MAIAYNVDDVVYVNGKAHILVPVPFENPFIGEVDGKKYYLGPVSNTQMTWEQAKGWAASIGGELMPREVGVLAFKRDEIRQHFRTDDWYWLADECSSSYAWYQLFTIGNQNYTNKSNACYVQAVFVK